MYFQINVTPKAQKSAGTHEKAPDVQAVLVLAPFQPQPHLNIESSVNVQAQTSLIIKNTSNRSLNVKVSRPPPEDRRILLSPPELSIPADSSATLWLSWTPLETGSWRDTLQLTDSRRLKYEIPLTTTCLAPKKSQPSKPPRLQKILAPSNENNPPKPLPTRKPTSKLPENKENITRRQPLPFTTSSKISQCSDPSANPNNPQPFSQNNGNIPQNNRNPSRSHQDLQGNRQHLEVPGVFNTSNFQLTPLKSLAPSAKPEILAQDFDFSPRDAKIISPGNYQEPLPLRRETYLNPDPKYCRLPPLEPVGQEEDDFDDSLSPKPDAQKNPGNFSALIDDLASFTTPKKSKCLTENRGLTVTRCIKEEITFSNNTFEISESRGDSRRHLEQLEFCLETPGAAGQDQKLQGNRRGQSGAEDFQDFSGISTSLRIVRGNCRAGEVGYHQNHPRNDYRQLETEDYHNFSGISTSSRGLRAPKQEVPQDCGLRSTGNHQRNHYRQSENDDFHNFSGISTASRTSKEPGGFLNPNYAPGASGNPHNSHYYQSETERIHDFSGVSTSSRISRASQEDLLNFPGLPSTLRTSRDPGGFLTPNYAPAAAGDPRKNHYHQSENDGILDCSGVSSLSRGPQEDFPQNYPAGHHQNPHKVLSNFPGHSTGSRNLNSHSHQTYDPEASVSHRQSDHPDLQVFNPPRHSSVEDFTCPNHFPLNLPQPPQTSQNPDYRRQSDSDHFLHPKLVKSFGRVSPVPLSLSRSSSEQSLPVSSSPIPSIRSSDSSTVQQVIEADLWLKDEPTTPGGFLQHQKSISLEGISEETSFRRQSSLPQIDLNLNLTKTFSSPLKPTVFEISPAKRSSEAAGGFRGFRKDYLRLSPKKPSKIMKERAKANQMILKRTKMGLTGQKSIPGVRVGKLSLAKLHKPKEKVKELSVRLHDPEGFVSAVMNPDPFAATMTEDPFLATSLYYDEKWMWNQEMEFKKWLNALLTPPEHLNADVDSGKVDVGKVWQSCRTKESIPLAETREAVSARYHTNHRLNTLRKAALVLFNTPEVRSILSKTVLTIEKGNLVVRQDRDLHRDIGLQKEILELFFSYNPLWLRIGLEVVYGETIPLSSNNDLVGLTKFLISRFFNDPFLSEKFSHQNSTLKTPSFMPNLNKFILKKFILLVYFLDHAKRKKLIGHDPCLFHKKALFKESREILLNFSRQTLSGVGDITKMLKPHGYLLTHKQTYLDEYDYAVKDLAVDLRDGVRLCRVMELMIGEKNLTSKCRVPAISRLQKVHNAELALAALHEAGYIITGDIDAKSVADGHREKTLSLLWQIIYKFQAPRFEKAAKVMQKWWRANLYYILVRNYLRKRRTNAAITIQCCWRSYRARKIFQALKIQRQIEFQQKNDSARTIQTWWRSLKDRRSFLTTKKAAMILQRTWRRYRTSKPYLEDLQKKKNAAVVVQRLFRSYRLMKSQRDSYLETRGAVLMLQRWYRAAVQGRKDLEAFRNLRKSTIFVQGRFRANESMKLQRNNYLQVLTSVKTIQRWWRGHLLTKSTRNEFIIKKHSVRIISDWYRGHQLMKIDRKSFLERRQSAVVIQRAYRRYRETKDYRKHLGEALCAVVVLQTWCRRVIVQRAFETKRKSAIIIQRWYRSAKLTSQQNHNYQQLKKSAIVIQKNFKMRKARENYLRTKRAVGTVSNWYLNLRKSRAIRDEFSRKKIATITLQRYFRGLQQTRRYRREFVELKTQVLQIQTRWRLKILTRKTRAEFLKTKASILKIQTIVRGILARKSFRHLQQRERAAITLQRYFRGLQQTRKYRREFLELRTHVLQIQSRWRLKILTRKTRAEFLKTKASILQIQTIFRGILARKSFRHLQQRERAAKILQRRWRARKLGKQVRENYLNKRKSVVCIQKRLRATLAARRARDDYETLRKSVINVQRRFRAQRMMRTSRESFLEKKRAIVLLQSVARMRKGLWEYQRMRKAAVVIQRKWRCTVVSRKTREDYLELKRTSIALQKRWRANLEGKRVREDFLRMRAAVVWVQRTWRKKLRDREWEEAAVVIQTWWRSILVARRERQTFERKRRSAVVIQQFFRGWMEARRRRGEFVAMRRAAEIVQRSWRRCMARRVRKKMVETRMRAVLVVQGWWRLVLERRRLMEEEREILRRQIWAAGLIQAAWRGHQVRKEQSAKIKELRIRSKRAAEAAVPSTTVAYRLQEAMNALMTFNNVGQLSMCLACIDTLTRLSIRGCVMFCELQLVEKIYDLLEQSNRSLPWMDVCLRCTNILITLAKLPDTAGEVRKLEYMETVARLMNVTIKGQQELFLNLATLLWILMSDEGFRTLVINDQRTVWLVRSACSVGMKREGRVTPVNRKNTSMERIVVIPNAKPDWGLANRRPRCFLKVEHAVLVLMDMFGIQNFAV